MRPAEADVLYAPGLRTGDEIRTVCATVSKPVNVLAFPDMSMDRIAAAGAQRVSLGSWLSHIACNAGMAVARNTRETGDFSALSA
jgi:2-methylisocitrate lyase-like PEP mutase family enzyme